VGWTDAPRPQPDGTESSAHTEASGRVVTEDVASSVAAAMEHLSSALNDPAAIIYVRDVEGRYVWVSDSYGEQLPFGRRDVIGKTNRELHGDAARNWEVADSFARISRDFITTAEDLYDTKRRRWRKFVSTKLMLQFHGVPYLVGISVEVKDANAAAYEHRLGELRARLIEQMGSV
jgi:PAS domain-containing protein